jgi:hypothetical protein
MLSSIALTCNKIRDIESIKKIYLLGDTLKCVVVKKDDLPAYSYIEEEEEIDTNGDIVQVYNRNLIKLFKSVSVVSKFIKRSCHTPFCILIELYLLSLMSTIRQITLGSLLSEKKPSEIALSHQLRLLKHSESGFGLYQCS